MELFSADFFSALAAIVVIDLVLAGDNAIVIALAARNVPAELQRRAVIWGTVGAVLVRSTLTMLVVWLLQIPGLLFVGERCWCGCIQVCSRKRRRAGAQHAGKGVLGRDVDHRERRTNGLDNVWRWPAPPRGRIRLVGSGCCQLPTWLGQA